MPTAVRGGAGDDVRDVAEAADVLLDGLLLLGSDVGLEEDQHGRGPRCQNPRCRSQTAGAVAPRARGPHGGACRTAPRPAGSALRGGPRRPGALGQAAGEVPDPQPRRVLAGAPGASGRCPSAGPRRPGPGPRRGTGGGRCTGSGSAPGPPGAAGRARSSASTSPSRSVTPGKVRRLSATYAPRSRESAIEASTSSQPYFSGPVVGLVEVGHRRVERDADGVEPGVVQRAQPGGEAGVGVDVQRARRASRPGCAGWPRR